MKNISVITAGNLGYWNTGMLTVEMAFSDLCQNFVNQVNVNWFVPYEGVSATMKLRPNIIESELPFKSKVIQIDSKKLLNSDLIVYWGDFLQARHYIAGEIAPLLIKTGTAVSHQDAMNQLGRTLLLSNAPDDVIRKTFIAGSTILMNRQSDYLDPDYGPAFQRLISGAKGVWMRDAISAVKVAQLRNGGTSVDQGVDCALLLTDKTVDSLPRTRWSEYAGNKDKIGIFLGGRTSLPPGAAIEFLNDISKKCGYGLDWLPWFGFDDPSYVKATDFLINPMGLINYRLNKNKITSSMRNDPKYTLGDLLGALKRYKFVITDTYHVCVNSWRAGTPAICISSSKPISSTSKEYPSLTDLKKLVLYSMYDALDYYVESDDLLDSKRRERRVAALLEILKNNTVSDTILDRIKRHSDDVRTKMTSQMTEIIGKC